MRAEAKLIAICALLGWYPWEILSLVYEAFRAVCICALLIFALSTLAWKFVDRVKLSDLVSKGANYAGAFALNISNAEMKSRSLLIIQALNPSCKKFAALRESVTYSNNSGTYMQIWYRYKDKDYTAYIPYVAPGRARTVTIAIKDGKEEALQVQEGIQLELTAEMIGADKLEQRIKGALRRFN